MDDILVTLLSQLGITDGTEAVALLVLLSMVCRLVGKAIPDDKTGVLGLIRKVCKVVGLYVSNRVKTDVTVSDVANAAMKIPQVAKDARSNTAYSPVWVGVIALGVMLTLSGCAATGTALTATKAVCAKRDTIQAAAEATIRALAYCPAPPSTEGN